MHRGIHTHGNGAQALRRRLSLRASAKPRMCVHEYVMNVSRLFYPIAMVKLYSHQCLTVGSVAERKRVTA